MISKVTYLLSNREKKKSYFLIGITLIMALLEMSGVASIMPFIFLLTNPDIVESNLTLKELYEFSKILGVETPKDFLFLSGIFVFFLLLTSISFKFLTFYLQLNFLAKCEQSIARRMIEGYLRQPYSWFLNRHSATLGKNILTEVNRVVNGGLNPLINLFSQVMIVILITTLLIIVDLKISIIVGCFLGGFYALIYKLTNKLTKYIGDELLEANKWRYSAIYEAFNAVKEMKIFGLEKSYVKRFSDPSMTMVKLSALGGIISQLPRYLLEAFIFGGMIILILYFMSMNESFIEILPIISLFAFAGYRLMPALQKIYISINQLMIAKPALDLLYNDIKSLQTAVQNQKKNVLEFKKNITLKHLNYNYPNTKTKALKDINLVIPARSFTAFVGPTGSGKTTMIDIILSLISPQEGTLEVDGQVIDKYNSRAWQNIIGYVPQNIYLSDDTITANIAFGVDVKDVNHESIYRAAKIANLHKFITTELPLKYETTIGERGVRLSGGQRQRIGIARAIYHDPKVLIFDEATNALDNYTEKAVMESIYNLTNEITIILIAHRLNTVKGCDTIFYLKEGKLKEQGTYEELVQKKIISGETSIIFKKNEKN